MARRWRKWLLTIAIGLPLLALGYDRITNIYWVGDTDLEVEFAITDVANGAPISDARIEIQQADGSFYEDQDAKEFVLTSNGDGLASQQCRQSMCSGNSSGFGIENHFAVHLPAWRFQVIADGYLPSPLAVISGREHGRQARRNGPHASKVVVTVSLHKKAVSS